MKLQKKHLKQPLVPSIYEFLLFEKLLFDEFLTYFVKKNWSAISAPKKKTAGDLTLTLTSPLETFLVNPMGPVHGIFANTCHKNQPNACSLWNICHIFANIYHTWTLWDFLIHIFRTQSKRQRFPSRIPSEGFYRPGWGDRFRLSSSHGVLEVIVTIVSKVGNVSPSPIYGTYPTYLYRGEIIRLLSTSRTSDQEPSDFWWCHPR